MSDERPKRPPRRRSYADEDRVRDLIDDVYRFSEKRYPFLIGTFAWLLREIGKSFAFSVKVLMRRNMGGRTYGLILAMDAYFVQKLFLFLSWDRIENIPRGLMQLVMDDPITAGVFKDFFWGGLIWRVLESLREPYGDSSMAFALLLQLLLGYALVVRCAVIFWQRIMNRYRQIKTFTYASGESIFFGWLKEKGVSEQTVLMVVEPAVVYLLGLFLFTLNHEATIIGPFLMVCGFALFFEEYLPYARRREKVLDKLDAEFEMARLQKMMAAYDGSEQGGVSKSVPAALADEKDAERYKAEMGRIAGKKNAAKL